jgi:uncharacterized protein
MVLHRFAQCVVLLLAAAPAFAQGIDCTKPHGTVEHGICALPALLAQDAEMAKAYARATADPASAPAIRTAQIAWIRAREAACGKLTDAHAIDACLAQFGRQRLAQLAQAAPTTPPIPASTAPVASAPTPSPRAAPPVVPVAAAPSEQLVAPQAPDVGIPAAAAVLDRGTFPAAEQIETLLHVTQPGRFAIIAKSATGTALQLVDMLTGPTETFGLAGQKDGRIDTLLDVGTYKVRAFSASEATGEVQLTVTPFRDVAGAAGMPLRGRLDADLEDFQQRRFWFEVREGQTTRIETAGRALHDLRVFLNGTDLLDAVPAQRTVEPTVGHPLTTLTFSRKLAPGVYEAVAYGGPPLTWTDAAAAQPFYLRTGASDALVDGWVSGRIGPMGREVFETAPETGALRLDLPTSAPVSLQVAAGGTAYISKTSREPTAQLAMPAGEQTVTISGAEGQPYRLRAFDRAVNNRVGPPGAFWLTLSGRGFGGDEPPATGLMLRRHGDDTPRIVASSGVRVGPGVGWRQRFNLRGPVTMLLDVTGPGKIAVRINGVAARADIVPIGSMPRPRADGAAQTVWDLAAGWYVLGLTPERNASGILDLSVGPPDALPTDAAAPGPADPEPSYGLVAADRGDVFDIFSGSAPGATGGFVLRPAPVDLTAGPLLASVPAGVALDVPVRIPGDGDVVTSEVGVGPVPGVFAPVAGPTAGQIGSVHLAASDRDRTIAIGWRAPVPVPLPVPPPPAQEVPERLMAGQAYGLDLDRDTSRNFALDVPEGGLFRVETLGRMRTAGSIGTAFIPALDKADANGIGQNFLIQRFLRAGHYRVAVTARESDGHLAITARPASTVTGAALVPGGRVRARMAADSGVVFPIEIVKAARYHLDLLSLGATPTARLEDEQGWPMLAAGDLSSLDQELLPGQYRLMVQPTGVAARVVARLAPVEALPQREGHGPFTLAFDAIQKYTWREPAGRNDSRVPDIWRFTLEGPAKIRLAIGDGMVADLIPSDGKTVARLTKTTPFNGVLGAGDYRVEASSQGRNDRLDYTLALASDAIQPAVPRQVKLPGSVFFAMAEERVVSLTSFGSVPMRGVLRRGDGSVIGRFGERANDWNIAVARRLPAGSYRLDLQSSAPPTAVKVDTKDPVRAPDASSDEGDQANADDNGDADGNAMADQGAAPQQSDAADNSDNADASSNDTARADAAAQTTELRLALLREEPPETLGKCVDLVCWNDPAWIGYFPGRGVHIALLPHADPGQLLALFVSSTTELAAALERQGKDGRWQTVASGLDRGWQTAVPGDGAAWRLSAWTVDGGPEPVEVRARVVDAVAQPLEHVVMADASLPGAAGLMVARVKVPGAEALKWVSGAGMALDLPRPSLRLQASSLPGRAITPPDGHTIVPQSEDLWLFGGGEPHITLAPLTPQPNGATALAVPAHGAARLGGAPGADGTMRLWLAQSGLGQPGLDAGHGMGVAPGSALALGVGPVRAFDASGNDDPLPLRVAALDLASQTPRALDGPFAAPLPPHSVTPVTLPVGQHVVRLDLAAGTAAVANWRTAGAITAWAGGAALSRSIAGDFTDVLLVNTTDHPTPVALGWTPLDDPMPVLESGSAYKRFFGAAGSIDVPADAKGRLLVAGGTATLIDAAGHVSRGTSLALDGAARVTIDHGPGLLAAWVEGADGRSPWPTPVPQQVKLPQRLAMHDAAMTLRFDAATPMLLHARTTAPVILAVGDDPPVMFPSGADFHRAVPAGERDLRVISPHDGPLSGTVELDGEPITPATEGIGTEMALAPGGSAAFGFEVVRSGPVGVGLRAEPDRLQVRLLAADGKLLGEGVAQLQQLKPGRYVLEASVPADATTTLLRPAIVGIAPRRTGPPPDVVNMYLALAGRAPVQAGAPIVPVSGH